MNSYLTLADDFYVNLNVSTEMDLPTNRETVLHFFEQLQKHYPEMQNFYARNKQDFVLEEDKDNANYRWCSVEQRRVSSGIVNPEQMKEALDQHQRVLELAHYGLSVSPLDCDAIDFLMGFDFSYRGNQCQLVAEALGLCPALEKLGDLPGARTINYEPNITIALDEDCRLQCRLSVEPRTNAYQIRTGDYLTEHLSVYVTARHYGSLPGGETYAQMLRRLEKVCTQIVDEFAVETVLQPLARAIALGS